jgi:hypothetical protein
MAMRVIAAVGDTQWQCSSMGGMQTASTGQVSSSEDTLFEGTCRFDDAAHRLAEAHSSSLSRMAESEIIVGLCPVQQGAVD